MSVLWYHGGPRVTDWSSLRWDRDRSQSDLNAEGPGLYFTNDFDEAAGYIGNGVILRGKTKPSFRFLPKKRPSPATLEALYTAASAESQEIFLSNWGVEWPASKHEVTRALSQYTKQPSLLDAAVLLYHDLFRYDSKAFVEAMFSLGFDGFIVDKGRSPHGKQPRKHLIVWNPRAITIEELG